eukprot:5964261-Amphidinium_carterae.4
MANGVYSASIYYRRAEDISIEFVPEHNGRETVNLNLMGCMGPPMGVWNIVDWQRIDTSAQSTLWLDHSISAWAITDTQCHLNDFTAITMLNIRSMSQRFGNWCDQNTLTGVLNKCLEADGTIKQQYAVADNGVERDHKQAMSLHRWHRVRWS